MENTAYQKLAKEFMDLWQKQLSAVMSDKQFIQAMLGMFQSMQAPGFQENAARSAAAADAAPADDANHGLLAELAFRLAMCEKRLAALEERQKPAGKPKAGTGARRGSKKPRQ